MSALLRRLAVENMAVENMRFTLGEMAALGTSRSIFFADGGFAFAAGADSASMNWAFFPPALSRSVDENTVKRVCSFFEELKQPFVWPIFPESNYMELLEDAGMRLRGERLVMACPEISPEKNSASGSLASGVVTFEINKDADVWAKTASMAFGFPQDAPASLVNLARGFSGNENFYLILAKKDGKPAGTAMLSLSGGRDKSAGIYYFATLPPERNKGIGGAMLQEAERLAWLRGCNVITLQATPAGALFYASRGFMPLFRLPFYSLS